MKRKDQMYPTIEEHYQLQLREVVSESYQQRRSNRAGADREFALRAAAADSMDNRAFESTTTLH